MISINIQDLLKQLKIDKVGEYASDSSYIIELDNDTEYGKFFSLLERSEILTPDENSSVLNFFVSNLMYRIEDITLNLIGDFENDSYKLVIKGK